jgi:hypothetical protein
VGGRLTGALAGGTKCVARGGSTLCWSVKMRRAIMVLGSVAGIGVAIQLALTIVGVVAGQIDRPNAGSLAGDAGFFAAFLGLGLVPFAVLVVAIAVIGKCLQSPQNSVFFTRAIWAAITTALIALALLVAGVGALGGGIIPH